VATLYNLTTAKNIEEEFTVTFSQKQGERQQKASPPHFKI
jgi:hypothetical protein